MLYIENIEYRILVILVKIIAEPEGILPILFSLQGCQPTKGQ